jgi:hypothetical protein
MWLVYRDDRNGQARIRYYNVKITASISLTIYQARWPEPPIRIILQQFGAEHCRFYLAPGDLVGKRFLGCVE